MHMASTETLGGFPRKMLSLEFLENDIRGNLNSCKMFADSVMQCQVDLKKNSRCWFMFVKRSQNNL